jgi:hypothetical protein
MFAVANDDETGLLALQKFFDDHAGLALRLQMPKGCCRPA